jgi:hypothetical protein
MGSEGVLALAVRIFILLGITVARQREGRGEVVRTTIRGFGNTLYEPVKSYGTDKEHTLHVWKTATTSVYFYPTVQENKTNGKIVIYSTV